MSVELTKDLRFPQVLRMSRLLKKFPGAEATAIKTVGMGLPCNRLIVIVNIVITSNNFYHHSYHEKTILPENSDKVLLYFDRI